MQWTLGSLWIAHLSGALQVVPSISRHAHQSSWASCSQKTIGWESQALCTASGTHECAYLKLETIETFGLRTPAIVSLNLEMLLQFLVWHGVGSETGTWSSIGGAAHKHWTQSASLEWSLSRHKTIFEQAWDDL